MAVNPKFITLLEDIRRATHQGRVNWTASTFDDSFQTRLDETWLRVAREEEDSADGTAREVYSAGLYDMLHRADEIQLVTSDTDEGKYQALLKGLYNQLYERSRGFRRDHDDLLERLISRVKTGQA
jgi:hypothetical protein